MIFMFLFYSDERQIASMSREDRNGLVERHVSYNHDVLEQHATVLATRGLEPSHMAHTVRPREGEITVRRGPYAQGRESLAGFYLVECRDTEHALELARMYPMPAGLGCIEVRPVMQSWDYAPNVDTSAAPETVWRVCADVERWPSWQSDVVEVRLDGPLRTGATGTISRIDRVAAPLRIVSAAEGQGYVSELELAPGVSLRTEHELQPLPDGGTRIVHHCTVPRALLDTFGLDFAPALYAQMQQTLKALAATAEALAADGAGR